MSRLISLILISVFTQGAVAQALKFSAIQLEDHPKFGQRYAQFVFKFQNTSQRAITVNGADVSCTCATYIFDKVNVEPLETGTVTVLVDVKNKSSMRYSQLIAVRTSEPAKRSYPLTAIAIIPGTVTAEPRIARWIPGEASSKRFHVSFSKKASQDTPALTEATTTSENFTIKVEPDGNLGFWIEVTPKITETTNSGIIKLGFGVPDELDQIPELFLYVDGR